jgi:RNA polymerase sigma factor (TIGR02999 family)
VRENQPGTDQLFSLVYDELKRLARRYLRRERSSHTLQPTALVNEAYIQLSSLKSAQWQSRSHFMGVAALAMRRVLTDHARDKRTAKRGGGNLLISLDQSPVPADPTVWDYDDLDVALSKLEAESPPLCRIVELRFFGGLSIDETAEFLQISAATVKRKWVLARAWLFREMAEPRKQP